jgi:hypothetical protein
LGKLFENIKVFKVFFKNLLFCIAFDLFRPQTFPTLKNVKGNFKQILKEVQLQSLNDVLLSNMSATLSDNNLECCN